MILVRLGGFASCSLPFRRLCAIRLAPLIDVFVRIHIIAVCGLRKFIHGCQFIRLVSTTITELLGNSARTELYGSGSATMRNMSDCFNGFEQGLPVGTARSLAPIAPAAYFPVAPSLPYLGTLLRR